MTDLTNILGIALIGVGAASAVYGTILCYSVKVICWFGFQFIEKITSHFLHWSFDEKSWFTVGIFYEWNNWK